MKQSREVRSQRQSDFKKGIDTDEARRRRDDNQYSIRKNKREDKLMKRRHQKVDSHIKVVQKEKPHVKTVMKFTVKDDDESIELENELYDLLYNDDTDIIENVQKLNSKSFDSVIEAAVFFRTTSSRENPPLDKLINVIPKLVGLSTSVNYPDLQYETLWTLSNIAAGESKHTNHVATHNNINVFVKLLESQEIKVRDHAILVLGNIAGDSSEFRKIIMNVHPNVIKVIMKNIQYATKGSYAQNAIWLLSNLTREKPHFSYEAIPEKIIPMLRILLNYPRDQLDSDLLGEIFWLISYLTNRNDSEKIIDFCIKNGIIAKVIELTYFNKTSKVEMPAIKILGNIAFLGDNQTQHLIDNKIFVLLPQLLRSNNKIIRKEAFYTLSNIAAGTKSQQEELVNFNNNQLISDAIFTVNDDSDWTVKKEAAYVIFNLINNKQYKYIKIFLKKLVITPVVNLLDSMSIDTITVALKILKHLLESDSSSSSYISSFIEDSRGLDKIEMLQSHDNNNVYDLALDIIETYFSGDDDEYSLAPPLLDQWESHHSKTQFDF
jgi:importin subunit alpha-6/7